jgi:amino acid permease
MKNALDQPLLGKADYDSGSLPEIPNNDTIQTTPFTTNPLAWLSESMEKGRQRSSVLSLVSCALGTGVLTLPSAFSESGLLVGIFITFVAAVVNGWGFACLCLDLTCPLFRYVCHVLSICCASTKSSSYEEIGVTLLGARIKMIIDVVQVLSIHGCVGRCSSKKCR